MSKKILVINGPNLEMLGKRDKATYGDFSLESLEKLISEEANAIGCQVEFFQNNIVTISQCETPFRLPFFSEDCFQFEGLDSFEWSA